MATVKTNDFKNGMKILQDGNPCNIVSSEHVQPGKGQAFVRVNYRNLLTGRVLEKTFKSGETIELAEVMDLELQYLYSDGEFWHFMDASSYEQHQADAKVVDSVVQWLVEQDVCMVTFWNGNVISITPPNFIVSEVVATDPGLRGDTASGGTKPATLATGATVQVPLFVELGEFLKVDTRDGGYMSRIKK